MVIRLLLFCSLIFSESVWADEFKKQVCEFKFSEGDTFKIELFHSDEITAAVLNLEKTKTSVFINSSGFTGISQKDETYEPMSPINALHFTKGVHDLLSFWQRHPLGKDISSFLGTIYTTKRAPQYPTLLQPTLRIAPAASSSAKVIRYKIALGTSYEAPAISGKDAIVFVPTSEDLAKMPVSISFTSEQSKFKFVNATWHTKDRYPKRAVWQLPQTKISPVMECSKPVSSTPPNHDKLKLPKQDEEKIAHEAAKTLSMLYTTLANDFLKKSMVKIAGRPVKSIYREFTIALTQASAIHCTPLLEKFFESIQKKSSLSDTELMKLVVQRSADRSDPAVSLWRKELDRIIASWNGISQDQLNTALPQSVWSGCVRTVWPKKNIPNEFAKQIADRTSSKDKTKKDG